MDPGYELLDAYFGFWRVSSLKTLLFKNSFTFLGQKLHFTHVYKRVHCHCGKMRDYSQSTGRRQTLCDKSNKNFVWNTISPNYDKTR